MSHEQNAGADPAPITRVIAQAVKDLRRRHGWTAEQLGAEMTKTGIKWDRYTVANLERGRRQALTVDEFLALAYVLGVPPLRLLLPVDLSDGGRVGASLFAITPTVSADWYRFAGWLRAKTLLSHADRDRHLAEGWAIRNFFEAMDAYADACEDEADLHRRLIQQEVRPESPEILAAARQMWAASVARYIDTLLNLVKRGLSPPPPAALRRISEAVAGARAAGTDVQPQIKAVLDAWEVDDAS